MSDAKGAPASLKALKARPNQVWAMDITYIPMARGFVYLAVAKYRILFVMSTNSHSDNTLFWIN